MPVVRFLEVDIANITFDQHATVSTGEIMRVRVWPQMDFLLPALRCLTPKDFEGNGNYQFALRMGENDLVQSKIAEFEKYIFDCGRGRCLGAWFPGKTLETMPEFVRLDKTPGDKLSLLNLKLQHWQGVPKFELFENKSKKLLYGKLHKKKDLETILQKNANVTAVIRCNGIWINDTKWGVSFSLIQALVEPPSEPMKGKWIGDMEEDD
jgi:hypothetical protein